MIHRYGTLVHPKLAWLSVMCSSLGMALGTSISHTVEDTVDPIKKRVFLEVGESLGKKDFNPLQRLIHGFAKANDCVIPKIYKTPRQLVLEVLVKTRHGPVMDRNPLSGDKPQP